MPPRSTIFRWEVLEANAHRPEVQERIREEIRRGTIRVRPLPGGGIQIMPVRSSEVDGDRVGETLSSLASA